MKHCLDIWAVPALVLLTLALVPLSGCDDSGDSDGTDPETDTIPGTDVDALTAATPNVASALLTETNHPAGWAKEDCLSCHATKDGGKNHNGNQPGYTNAQCTTCHGQNGAPRRPAGHDNLGCLAEGCHDTAHAGRVYADPNDCIACHRYEKPSSGGCAFEETHDVVVIGAGGGGLGAAAIMAKKGLDVIVLEQHHKVGGYMTGFSRKDENGDNYRFEASLHALDAMDTDPLHPGDPESPPKGMNVDIFRDLGILDPDPAKSKIHPVLPDPMYYNIFPDEEVSFNIPADPQEYRALLKQKFPDQAAGIDAVVEDMYRVDGIMRVILGLAYAGKDIMGEDIEELFTAVTEAGYTTDDLMYVQSLMGDAEMTVSDYLEGFGVTDQKLIAVLTKLAAFAGLEPERCSVLFWVFIWNNYHIGGFSYFEGGSQAVTTSLAEVVEENSGTVRLNSRVVKVLMDEATKLATGVMTEDGTCYKGDWVVSNTNAPALLLDMVGEEYLADEPVESPYHPVRLKQGNEESLEIGLSAFQVFLGVDHDFTPEFTHDGKSVHEIMVSHNYDPTADFDAIRRSDVLDQGYAICNYTIQDPGNAPAGKNVIELTGILMYDWQDEWHSGLSHEAYENFKYAVGMKLVERAEKDFLPGLSQYIEVMEVGSPITMEGFTSNPSGTIFGWANSPQQSMNARMPSKTPIDNLYIAGAWSFPGGGQSASVDGGWIVGNEIVRRASEAE